MKLRYLLLLFIANTLMAGEAPVLNIDKSRVTTSGISAGAIMAHQLHIAYSDIFSGAGIVSGGPYNCAENSMLTALSRCMMNTDEPLPVPEFVAGIHSAAEAGGVADTGNLADDRVWLFHGTKDSKISAEVHSAAATLYAEFIPAEQMHSVDNVVTEHVFPTKGQGNGCMEFVSPFVGDCDYDAAGQLLSYLYPGLETPNAEVETGLLEVTLPGAGEADLLDAAYLYVPAACGEADNSCALHLVLHGCAQSAETVGKEFIELSGYLPWAEANDIVMAFPQVKPSMVAPINPQACWDWWGYTGDDYAKRNGKQMHTLVDWINGLSQ